MHTREARAQGAPITHTHTSAHTLLPCAHARVHLSIYLSNHPSIYRSIRLSFLLPCPPSRISSVPRPGRTLGLVSLAPSPLLRPCHPLGQPPPPAPRVPPSQFSGAPGRRANPPIRVAMRKAETRNAELRIGPGARSRRPAPCVVSADVRARPARPIPARAQRQIKGPRETQRRPRRVDAAQRRHCEGWAARGRARRPQRPRIAPSRDT